MAFRRIVRLQSDVSTCDTETDSQVTWSQTDFTSIDSSEDYTEHDSGLGLHSLSAHNVSASDLKLLTRVEGGKMTLDFRIKEPYEEGDIYRLYQPMFDWINPAMSIYDIVMVCPEQLEDVAEDSRNMSFLEIPSLAIVLFLSDQSNMTNATFTMAQKHFLTDDWTFHHTENISRSNLSNSPDNNQDYFLAEEGYPLCSVRKLHVGKSLLRFVRFICAENWQDNLDFYSLVLGQHPDFVKADFCLFTTGSQEDYDIQLALKRVPAGIKCKSTPQASLSFRITHLGNLVPLLPKRCCPGEHNRWETRDPDENHVIFEVVSPPKSERLSVKAVQKHNAYYGRMAVRDHLQLQKMGALSKSCTALNMLGPEAESPSWGFHRRTPKPSSRHRYLEDYAVDTVHHRQYRKHKKRSTHRNVPLTSPSLSYSKSQKSRSCANLLDISREDDLDDIISSYTNNRDGYRYQHGFDKKGSKHKPCTRQGSLTEWSDVSSSVYNIRAMSDRKPSFASSDTYVRQKPSWARQHSPAPIKDTHVGRYKKRSNSTPVFVEQFRHRTPPDGNLHVMSDREDGEHGRDKDEYTRSKHSCDVVEDVTQLTPMLHTENENSRSPDEGIDVNDIDDTDETTHRSRHTDDSIGDSNDTSAEGESDGGCDYLAESDAGSSCAALDPEASIFSLGEDNDSVNSLDDLCEQDITLTTEDIDETNPRQILSHSEPTLDDDDGLTGSSIPMLNHEKSTKPAASQKSKRPETDDTGIHQTKLTAPTSLTVSENSVHIPPHTVPTDTHSSHSCAVSASANDSRFVKRQDSGSSGAIFQHPFFKTFQRDHQSGSPGGCQTSRHQDSPSARPPNRASSDKQYPGSLTRDSAVGRRVTFLERVDSHIYSEDGKTDPSSARESHSEATMHHSWSEAQQSSVGFFV